MSLSRLAPTSVAASTIAVLFCVPTTAARAAAPPADAPPAAGAALSKVAFLAGAWEAVDGGNRHEEHWMPPAGDTMLGMFRWQGADGSVRLNELLQIAVEDGTPVLRLRHFDAALMHWPSEAKGGPALPLAESGERRVVFRSADTESGLASVEYAIDDADRLAIAVAFHDPARETLRFALDRVEPPASAVKVASTVTPEQARAAFERFKALAGDWQEKSTKGWTKTIRYAVLARGSMVLETSVEDGDDPMATCYHMDGDRLMLTHYCAAKNQPRLVLTSVAEDGALLDFTFLDATNLPSRDRGHMDRVKIRFVADGQFESQWTWYENGVEGWMEKIDHRKK